MMVDQKRGGNEDEEGRGLLGWLRLATPQPPAKDEREELQSRMMMIAIASLTLLLPFISRIFSFFLNKCNSLWFGNWSVALRPPVAFRV